MARAQGGVRIAGVPVLPSAAASKGRIGSLLRKAGAAVKERSGALVASIKQAGASQQEEAAVVKCVAVGHRQTSGRKTLLAACSLPFCLQVATSACGAACSADSRRSPCCHCRRAASGPNLARVSPAAHMPGLSRLSASSLSSSRGHSRSSSSTNLAR